MLEPIGDVFGRLQMVLARRKAAPGFAVGKIQREIAGDQCDSAGARRGQGRRNNHHNRLYNLGGDASLPTLTANSGLGG